MDRFDMNISSLLAVLLITYICFSVSYVFYQLRFHPLASIPGPLLARLSRLWITYHARKGDMNIVMIALHAKYGALVRTGPNELSVAGTQAIKTIYGAGTNFRKSEWYSVWQGHRKFDLFAERNESIHAAQRRLVSRAYSMDSLRQLEPYVDNAVKVFLHCMADRSGQVVDLGNWVQLFAFDVIGEVTFSKRFGFMEAGQDDGSFAQIEAALSSGAWIGQLPFLYWVHDALMPYIGNHLGVTARHGSLRSFAISEISRRQDRGSDHKDILSQLFATQKEKPLEMNDSAVASMATSNIFAGSDTTAISIRAIIYHLLKNPLCKAKLIAELDSRKRDGRLSDPVTLKEAEDIPYLQAVMYEALRLHPAVGMSLPRVVPAGGATICGKYIPAETIVGSNPWVLGQSKEVYGKDVAAFRPERWMEQSSGDMHRAFFAFGAGARICIGRNISWMEISKLIPTLFVRFSLDMNGKDKEWETRCFWFVMQKGLHVRLTPR